MEPGLHREESIRLTGFFGEGPGTYLWTAESVESMLCAVGGGWTWKLSVGVDDAEDVTEPSSFALSLFGVRNFFNIVTDLLELFRLAFEGELIGDPSPSNSTRALMLDSLESILILSRTETFSSLSFSLELESSTNLTREDQITFLSFVSNFLVSAGFSVFG